MADGSLMCGNDHPPMGSRCDGQRTPDDGRGAPTASTASTAPGRQWMLLRQPCMRRQQPEYADQAKRVVGQQSREFVDAVDGEGVRKPARSPL